MPTETQHLSNFRRYGQRFKEMAVEQEVHNPKELVRQALVQLGLNVIENGEYPFEAIPGLVQLHHKIVDQVVAELFPIGP